MLKIVKTPTMKQFSDYFFTITKWKKKKSFVFFFPFFFFGDVIIHKTGTMLATGQGPGATPSGPGSVNGRGRCAGSGVTAGTGRNNKLGFKLKYLSGGGTSGTLEMKRTPHRCLGRCGSGAKLW